MRKVVVIGAGAAGMMAAISAAEHGAHTVVLEHKDRVGKKILPPGTEDAILQILYRHLSVIAVMILSFRGGSSHSLMRKRQWSFSRTSDVYAKNRKRISLSKLGSGRCGFRFPSHGDGAALCGSAHRDRSSGNHSEKEPVCHPNRKWECDRRPGDPGSRIQGGSCYRF